MRTHRTLVRLVVALAPILFAGTRGEAGEDPSIDPRARILAIELRRGPVASLDPWLASTADPSLRRRAIRALGRIGSDAAPRLRALLEGDEEPERVLALWAAGIVQSVDLAPSVRAHASSPDPVLRAAAAAALGWCNDRGVLDDLGPLLLDADPRVRAAALTGLARGGDEGALERVVSCIDDDAAEVRAAAWHAAWRLASRRAEAIRASGSRWAGAEAFVGRLVREHGADAARRVDLVRVIAPLLSPSARLADPDDDARLGHLLAPRAGDPRGDQEVLSRIVASRSGETVDGLLERYLTDTNLVTRDQAIDVLAASAALERDALVRSALRRETDARLADRLRRIEPRRASRSWIWDERFAGSDEVEDAALREGTALRLEWPSDDLGPPPSSWSIDAAERGLHEDATWMAVFDEASRRAARGGDDDVGKAREAWLASFLGSAALLERRPYVLAFALGTVEAIYGDEVDAAAHALAVDLAAQEVPHDEVERGLVGALAARSAATKDEAREAFLRHLERLASSARSAFARAAARDALARAGRQDLPRGGAANDWRGLPRPEEPLAAWGVASEGGPLDESEILRIAGWIVHAQPRVVIETTVGPIALELDAEAAPVHAVALVLAAHGGLYTGSRWHRLVPGFVIQGGDPHGHGAGNAGYTIPDEVSPQAFARGVLGMPKSVKDDGGCQLFLMLGDYAPLDERYTAYGRVVGSMAAVDALRIGDRIVGCRLEVEDR